MLHLMGEKKGMEFMQAFRQQVVAIRSGRLLITQLLASAPRSVAWHPPLLENPF